VLDHALQHLPAQVEPGEIGIAPLEFRHHAEGLHIVVEAAELRGGGVQRLFAGMAEGRMAEIVRQGDALGEIIVQPKRLGDRARDLRHLERMGQPGAEMVALVRHEDLGLLLQPAEGLGVDHPVAVAGEGGAGAAGRLGVEAAKRGRGIGGEASADRRR